MTQPLFPSTIGTQSRSVKFLTIKTVVRKTTVRPCPGAETRRCLRKGGVGPGATQDPKKVQTPQYSLCGTKLPESGNDGRHPDQTFGSNISPAPSHIPSPPPSASTLKARKTTVRRVPVPRQGSACARGGGGVLAQGLGGWLC